MTARPPAGGAWWRALAVALALSLATVCRADSPLTSTDFYEYYKDVRVVAKARFDEELVVFLLGQNPIDQKAAAINALGWKIEGRDFAARLVIAIAKRKGKRVEQMRLDDLTADEAFVVGYLRAMDDYLGLTAIVPSAADVRRQRPAEMLAYAEQRMPESFTVAMIAALVRAQENLSCETYRVVDRVVHRFPTSRRDMRTRAVDEILKYINLYLDSCPKEASKTDPKFDEIYSLAYLGRRIAAGTQAGLVLWTPESGSFETHPLGICSKLIVWRNSVWADCEKGLYRHDGQALTKVWASGSKESSAPKVGPDGALYVFDRDQLRRFDTPGGTLTEGRKLQATYHDAAFGADGTIWGIVFLRAIVHETPDAPEVYSLNSSEYPGGDPRSFYTGPDGSFWVVDFKSGFFRFDPGQRRFVHAADSPIPGAAIRIDSKRNTTWLLGYTNKLVRLAPPAPARSIPLSDGYYWDLLLEEDGSVWISSFSGLIHLKLMEDGPHLSKLTVNPQK